jgi:hypothetical protein
MELYHGSTVVVRRPTILTPVRALDFGPGFYVTSDFEQADRWARLQQRRRRAAHAVVSVYEFDEDAAEELLQLRFDRPDGPWLDFVVANRTQVSARVKEDLVIGPVADDNTMPVIDAYLAGLLTKGEAIRRLLPYRLSDQYAFTTRRARACLTFEEAR